MLTEFGNAPVSVPLTCQTFDLPVFETTAGLASRINERTACHRGIFRSSSGRIVQGVLQLAGRNETSGFIDDGRSAGLGPQLITPEQAARENCCDEGGLQPARAARSSHPFRFNRGSF